MQYDLVFSEYGSFPVGDGTKDVFTVQCTIWMKVPFVPAIGMVIRPPSPAGDGDYNIEYTIESLIWDCDNEEFLSSFDFPDPRDQDDEDATLESSLDFSRRNGWSVKLVRDHYDDDGRFKGRTVLEDSDATT